MKIVRLGLLIAAVGWLILLMMSIAWGIEDTVKKLVQQGEQTPLEQVVADTFTFEEFAEWTVIRQKFEARENKEREQQLACVAKGKNPKICVDPNWCLYPANFDKDECVWYKIKHGF